MDCIRQRCIHPIHLASLSLCSRGCGFRPSGHGLGLIRCPGCAEPALVGPSRHPLHRSTSDVMFRRQPKFASTSHSAMDTFILPSTVMDSIKPPRRWSRLPDEFPIQRMCPRVARFNAKSIMDISPTSSPLLGGAESPLSSSGSTFSFSSPPSSLLEPEAHLDPNAPSEALPRLRVHLKNHLSRVLPEVECPDDMPLETMIHRHAFAISARNEEIQSELRDSEKVDLKCFEELSSGVFGGSLFDRYMCRLLKWVKLLPETETNDDSDDDNSTSDGSGSEDDAAMGDSDASDASSQDDSDSPDFSGSSAESHSSEIIIPTTKSLPRPHVPPKHHTKSLPFLTSLREWAINHWLLTQYKLIIAHHFTSPDEIDRLFLRPARTVSPPTPTPGPLESRPTTKENAQILAHMQALTLLLKLRLLVEHERSDPERYWKMDFEHPKCQDEYAGSMLHQQNAFVGSMLNMYEDLVKRPLRFERDVQMRMMLMGGFFGFAEIEEESWFRGYDKERGELGEEVVVEVDDEVDEERERRELQFAKRLGTMVAPEWEEKKRGVSAWIDGVGSRGGGYGPSLGKAEKIALQGTTFRIEEGLNTLSRMEAEKLVTLHGGYVPPPPTTT